MLERNRWGSHRHGTKIENDDKFEGGSNKGGVDNTSGSDLSTTFDGSHSHSSVTNATGTGAAFDVRPKYFRLAFVVKLWDAHGYDDEKLDRSSAPLFDHIE